MAGWGGVGSGGRGDDDDDRNGRFARIMMKPKPDALPCEGRKVGSPGENVRPGFQSGGLTRPKKLDDDWTD